MVCRGHYHYCGVTVFVAVATVMLCVQVYIFDRLTNKRYENFMSVLDIYLNKHFSAALAFK